MIDYITGKGSWDDDDAPAPKDEPKPDQLKDNSIMWFGKHQGKMMLQVPADYLLWLENDSIMNNKTMDSRLKQYVDANRDSLKQEAGIKK